MQKLIINKQKPTPYVIYHILVLKLLKTADGIRSLLDTVGKALPQVNLNNLAKHLNFFTPSPHTTATHTATHTLTPPNSPPIPPWL